MQGRINSLEAGRGIAALAVVLLHAGTGMVPEQYSGHVGLNDLFNFGKYGVDFFFVLSGYIMNRVTFQKEASFPGALKFFVRRLFRILPAYWMVLLVSTLINRFQRGKVEVGYEWIFSQVFLLDSPLFVSAAWTLQFEFLFYFMIAIGICNRSVGYFLFMLWGVLLIYRSAFLHLGIAHDNLFQVISNPYCVLFFFGYIGCEIIERTAKGILYSTALVLLIGALHFMLMSVATMDEELSWRSLLGAIFVLVISVARRFERTIDLRAGAFVLLGKVSYSLYISHILVLGLSYWLLAKIGLYSHLHELIIIIFAVVNCIVVATILYLFVEKPFIRMGLEFERRRFE